MNLLRKLLPFLLVFSIAYGQPVEKKVELRGFGGLNTVATDFAIQPNECRSAYNIDWGRNVGAISKRYGYDSISTIEGMDSILGIYAAYYSDGSQQLFVVADTARDDGDSLVGIAQCGYGNIYVTAKGSVDFTALTRIWQYWGVQERPSFAMHDDNVYIVNGQNKGIVWDGDVARSWPPPAPGEPLIIPLDDSVETGGYGLDGQYRYAFLFYPGGNNANSALSYLSQPIKVNDGKVLLTHFPWAALDSIQDGWTTMQIAILRTKGDAGRITRADSVYTVATTVSIPDADSAYNYVYVDSISDASLGSKLQIIDDQWVGISEASAVWRRYGAPGIKARDTLPLYDTAGDTTGDVGGIYYGIPDQTDTLGVYYTCTFIDTITGIESDTGRCLYVYNDTADGSDSAKYFPSKWVEIYLPEVPDGDDGLVINLYRGHLLQLTYDDQFLTWDSSSVIAMRNAFAGSFLGDLEIDIPTYTEEQVAFYESMGKMLNLGDRNPAWRVGKRWVPYLSIDTIVQGEPHLVGQYQDTTGFVRDSLRYDSLVLRPIYYKSTPPPLVKQVMAHDGRLWSIQGSNVWKSSAISATDTLQRWAQAGGIALNRGDGDELNLIFPKRGVVGGYKNYSNYNIFQNSNLKWARTEVSGTFGCIASQSYAKGFGGHYYLSDVGVIRENEGPSLERTQSIELVSSPIRSFDNMSLIDKSGAIGFYYDRKYMLNVPAVGTTYVYDERANAWSIWDMNFDGAVLYGTESELGFFPGDTMYFFNDSTLYRYGTSEYDNYRGSGVGSTIVIIGWTSAPLFTNSSYVQINKIGLFNKSIRADTLEVRLLSASGAVKFRTYAPLTSRFLVRSFPPFADYYFYVVIGNSLTGAWLTNTAIDGIDIWYTDQGEVKVD